MKFRVGNWIKVFSLISALLCVEHPAQALTIGTTEYVSVASGKLDGYFGMWEYYKMGGTYLVHPTILDVNVTSSQIKDASLAGDGAPSKYVSNFMLQNVGYFGAVMSGDVKIENRLGQSLLELEYVSNGTFSGTLQLGAAGEADLVGLYRVTGGTWYDPGTLIYSTLNYATGYGRARHDFYWTNGTFNLYAAKQTEGPPTEVPEPATSALLISSLAAVARLRRAPRPQRK